MNDSSGPYTHPIPDELSTYPSIGGGTDYDPDTVAVDGRPCGGRVTVEHADWVVDDVTTFQRVFGGELGEGEAVWLRGDREFDLTGLGLSRGTGLRLPNSVTVASDRGIDGSDGATLLVTDSKNFAPLFCATDDCRLTGLRFIGPETTYREYDWTREGNAVQIAGDRVEIDDCLFRGWGHAGVKVGTDVDSGPIVASAAHVHHSTFVDNALEQLGYGITVWHGDPCIHHCYLDGNRHSIAGNGAPDCAYHVVDNVFGPHSYLQVIDMHRGDEVAADGGRQAGQFLNIRNNLVMRATSPTDGNLVTGIYIRGIPAEGGVIRDNRFGYADDETNSDGNRGPIVFEGGVPDGVTVDGNRFDDDADGDSDVDAGVVGPGTS